MGKFLRYTDEFYIGYVSSAPSMLSKQIKLTLLVVGVMIILIALTVGFSQRSFSTASFEYGRPTRIEGVIYISPIPHIRIPLGQDNEGKAIFQNVLLVGSGKSGAEEVLKRIEEKASVVLHGKNVTLS